MIQSKIEYNSIDILKFLLAICIVAIHAQILDLNVYSDWMISSMIFRLGVPFFFVVSGFFLAGKLYKCGNDKIEGRKTIIGYCKKLLPPLIIWGGYGLILRIIHWVKTDTDTLHFVYYITRTIFYPLSAMWYLWASIIGAFILFYIYSHSKHWKRVWLIYSILAYTFLLLNNNYNFLVEDTVFEQPFFYYRILFASPRNGVFLAPVYLGIGFMLRDEKLFHYFRLNKWIPVTGCIGGFVLLFTEATFLFGCNGTDDRGFFISQLILIPSIVVTAMLFNVKLRLPYTMLRRMSIGIYFTHASIIGTCRFIPGLTDCPNKIFTISLILSITLSLLSYFSGNKRLQLLLG